MKSFYIIKEVKDNEYKTYSLFDDYSPITYEYMYDAINLVKIRLNKQQVKLFQIPFTNLWFAF